MAEIIQEAPALPTAPEPTPEAPPSPEEPSLSEHIETFHKTEESEPEKPRTRHRSAKNWARAEDVPRIKELTKEVNEWKAKYEAATAKPETPTAPAPPQYVPPPQPSAPTTFDEPEPKLGDEKYASAEDPYAEHLLDKADWRGRKKAFEAQQQQATQQTETQRKAANEAAQARATKYKSQLDQYIQAHPDHRAAFEQMPQVDTPPLLAETIWSLDDPPGTVYALLQKPDLFFEFLSATDGKPVSAAHVALAAQWLRSRLQAGTTGAAVHEVSPPPAPRPPTPVRTRPMPPVDGPPSDGASLMEHARYFHKGLR